MTSIRQAITKYSNTSQADRNMANEIGTAIKRSLGGYIEEVISGGEPESRQYYAHHERETFIFGVVCPLSTPLSSMNRLANLDGTKPYKEKFRIWGWQKRTTRQYAQWMIQKAIKRKRDDDKETVFFYGGLKWDESRALRSGLRSKKASAERGGSGEYVDKPWV